MELLLILSAMLSAVTGAFTGVRGPDARIAQAEAAVGVQLVHSAIEQRAAPVSPARPADAPATTDVPRRDSFVVAPAAPLYADRLIE